MPCTYYTPEEEAAIAHAAQRQMAAEINKLTRLLCEATEILDKLVANGSINGYNPSPELIRWKIEHAFLDASREG